MPIINQTDWDKWVKNNTGDYGKATVDVAREVMRLLDEGKPVDNPRALICESDKSDELTGFMAGCVASIVSRCHSRGEEFRRQWNLVNQIGTEGEKANKGEGVLNPAIIKFGEKT